MRLDDFCALTPSEYEAVCKAWRDEQENIMRDDWERMRLSTVIGIQPHLKKKIAAEKLIPFPWEKHKTEAPQVPAEEARKRFERLTKTNIIQQCPSQ